MEKLRILFISRAYPPIVGGIENHNYELSIWLAKCVDVKIIANRHGKIFLPFFLPFATLRALLLMRKYDILLLGDGVLGCVGWGVKLFHRRPVVCLLHGLDLTFRNVIYQNFWVKKFLPKLDKFICVGNETVRVAKSKGLSENKLIFIPSGVDTDKNLSSCSRSDLEKVFGRDLKGKKVILTSGRLIKRKGVEWFIQNVLPKLSENILYVVAGDGPNLKNIRIAIRNTQTDGRVILLGYVADEIRNMLFGTVDLFIQPNIEVEGDMEGFGISVIEASSCRLPVVASRLEGLQDAIKDSYNGFLVTPGNPQKFADKIMELLSDDIFLKDFGERARQFTIAHYHWKIIIQKYIEVIKSCLLS